jgi:hypothetical protein
LGATRIRPDAIAAASVDAAPCAKAAQIDRIVQQTPNATASQRGPGVRELLDVCIE